MQRSLLRRFLMIAVAVAVAATVSAGEIQSTMRSVSGSYEAQGFRLEPAYDIQIPAAARDLSAPQVFELMRPDGRPVTIGRMFTSCSCIQLESPKRTFDGGERILLQLHNIRPTPPAGQVYAVFVQITKPVRVTLRIDTFVHTGAGLNLPPPPAVAESPAAAGEAIAASINNELAALLSSVDTQPEGTGNHTQDFAFDGDDPDFATIVEDGADAGLVRLPDGLDLSEAGEEDDDPSYLLGTADLAQDVTIDPGREAMDSYFQGEDDEGAADDGSGEIGGDLPDFYAQQPVESPEPAIEETPDPETAQNEDIGTQLPPEAQAQLAQLQAQLEAQTGRPVIVAPVQVAPATVLELQPQAVAPVQVQPPSRPEPAANWPVQAVTLITVGVRDMPAAVRFYEALGLPRAARGKYDQTAFFQLNGQVLALYPMNDLLQEQNMESSVPAPGGITLALHVREKADVWTLYQRFIDAGGTSLRVPAEMASGAVSSYVADPDGNPWEISFVPQFRIDENGGLWLP